MKNTLREFLKDLTPYEKRLLLKGFRGGSGRVVQYDHTFSSKHIRFGYYSDPHVGNKKFSESLWLRMVAYFKAEGIEVVYCPGDNLEGMSGRPGHIYELAQIGASAQIEYASELFNAADGLQFYVIDGNHDQWFKEKGNIGLVSGRELESRCKNVKFLGEWEADVKLGKGVVMKLYHANDGTAYALSYKIQKLIESFTGGEKPALVLSGHYHKAIAVYLRNVFGFECGTLCGQTRWMRGKKIQAHMGFGIIDIWVSARGGIERLTHQFVPHFTKDE